MTGRLLLTAACVVFLAGGCKPGHVNTQAGSGVGGNELQAIARPPVPDLPVPNGFQLDESRSGSFAEAGSRYVSHVYKGSADKYAISRFYKRYMPISRWTLVTDMFVKGNIILDFEKEAEHCRLIIEQGGRFSASYVYARMWSRGAPAMTQSR